MDFIHGEISTVTTYKMKSILCRIRGFENGVFPKVPHYCFEQNIFLHISVAQRSDLPKKKKKNVKLAQQTDYQWLFYLSLVRDYSLNNKLAEEFYFLLNRANFYFLFTLVLTVRLWKI